jgi:hypothetical protein
MNSFDAPATTRRLHRVRPRDVADLTVTAAYHCISVLMPTDPGPRMTSPDAKRLHGLVEDVDQQLREHGIPARARLMRKLASRVQQVSGQPTDRALAIYVSLAVSRTFWLSVPVTVRSVVEHTFATRPLVTSLHRMPPHVLLLLHRTCAHLYQGADGGLWLVGSRDSFQGPRPVRVPQQGHGDVKEAAEDETDGFLRAVDHLVGRYRAEHPSPLVLGGSAHVVDRFLALSRNLHRLAGRIPLTRGETASDLARASSEVVEHYLRSRREEALSNLRTALSTRPVDVASGMAACWHAVHQRVPGMLLVEHDFVSPGRPEDYEFRLRDPVLDRWRHVCTTSWTTSSRWSSCEGDSSPSWTTETWQPTAGWRCSVGPRMPSEDQVREFPQAEIGLKLMMGMGRPHDAVAVTPAHLLVLGRPLGHRHQLAHDLPHRPIGEPDRARHVTHAKPLVAVVIDAFLDPRHRLPPGSREISMSAQCPQTLPRKPANLSGRERNSMSV